MRLREWKTESLRDPGYLILKPDYDASPPLQKPLWKLDSDLK